jgi:ribosomal protein S18 acetylase RimI-like enzyme
MVIEPANSDDLEALVDLLQVLFTQESEMRPDPARQRAGLAMILSQPALGTIFVARGQSSHDANSSSSAATVGMISVLYSVSTMLGSPAGTVEDFIVRPEYRGLGIGRKLMSAVFAHARENGLLRLSLQTDRDNDAAQRLYREYGFQPSTMLLMRCHLEAS